MWAENSPNVVANMTIPTDKTSNDSNKFNHSYSSRQNIIKLFKKLKKNTQGNLIGLSANFSADTFLVHIESDNNRPESTQRKNELLIKETLQVKWSPLEIWFFITMYTWDLHERKHRQNFPHYCLLQYNEGSVSNNKGNKSKKVFHKIKCLPSDRKIIQTERSFWRIEHIYLHHQYDKKKISNQLTFYKVQIFLFMILGERVFKYFLI